MPAMDQLRLAHFTKCPSAGGLLCVLCVGGTAALAGHSGDQCTVQGRSRRVKLVTGRRGRQVQEGCMRHAHRCLPVVGIAACLCRCSCWPQCAKSVSRCCTAPALLLHLSPCCALAPQQQVRQECAMWCPAVPLHHMHPLPCPACALQRCGRRQPRRFRKRGIQRVPLHGHVVPHLAQQRR